MIEGAVLIAIGSIILLVGIGLIFLFKERKDVVCLIDGILCLVLCVMLVLKGAYKILNFDEKEFTKQRIEYHQKKLDCLRRTQNDR